MAAYLLDKQTACCNLPHDWLISLAMDLAALCVMWSHLAGFSEDVAFAYHFVATHLPPTFPPYRSATGIGYANKNYLKW